MSKKIQKIAFASLFLTAQIASGLLMADQPTRNQAAAWDCQNSSLVVSLCYGTGPDPDGVS